jgi:hypothetical protein
MESSNMILLRVLASFEVPTEAQWLDCCFVGLVPDEAKQQFDDAVAAAAKKKENADKVMKTRGKGRKK